MLLIRILQAELDDRRKKIPAALYDELGVEVYVLIDPDVETLEIYRRDTSGNWQGESVTDSVVFSVCNGCELRLTRTALFAP